MHAVCGDKSDLDSQAVEKIVHLIHEDGNIRYENLGTNYGMSGMMGKGLGQGYGMGMMPMQGAAAMYGGMQMPMGMDMASQGMGMAPGMPGVCFLIFCSLGV